jgi:hypothetical protein
VFASFEKKMCFVDGDDDTCENSDNGNDEAEDSQLPHWVTIAYYEGR